VNCFPRFSYSLIKLFFGDAALCKTFSDGRENFVERERRGINQRFDKGLRRLSQLARFLRRHLEMTFVGLNARTSILHSSMNSIARIQSLILNRLHLIHIKVVDALDYAGLWVFADPGVFCAPDFHRHIPVINMGTLHHVAIDKVLGERGA
jgi:hypothetical protein